MKQMSYFPKSCLVADNSLERKGLHILAGRENDLNTFLREKK